MYWLIGPRIASAKQFGAGIFDPGERLNQRVIAEAWDVSRTSFREAVRRLELEGLLEVQPHRGAFVVQCADSDLADYFLIRRLLEYEVVRQIAGVLAEREIEELELEARRGRLRRPNMQHYEYWDYDARFHHAIVQHVPSSLIKQILSNLENRPSLWRWVALYYPTDDECIRLVLQEHEAIIDALREGDPDGAAEAMNMHLLRTGERIQAQVFKLSVKNGRFNTTKSPRSRMLCSRS